MGKNSREPLLDPKRTLYNQHVQQRQQQRKRSLKTILLWPFLSLQLFCRIACILLISIPVLVYISRFLLLVPVPSKPLFPNELKEFHLLTESEKNSLWKAWKKQFGTDWSDIQEDFRRSIFFSNCEFVNKHNHDPTTTSVLQVHEHAALTDSEFQQFFTGLYLETDKERRRLEPGDDDFREEELQEPVYDVPLDEPLEPREEAFPQKPVSTTSSNTTTHADPQQQWDQWEVDWHKSGFTTRVKNQGKCGACWAFSSTAALESRCAIRGWNLVSLSVQELVDCAERRQGYRNDGCIGGFVSSAFDYVQHHSGSLRWENYHHYRRRVKHCKERTNTTRFDVVQSYHNIAPNMKDAMKELESGPITAAVFASHRKFRFYKSGIITSDCPNTIDHGVTVVGFGDENGIPFWKIKNSWGDHWGEEGYIRICRGCVSQFGGQCGVLKQLQAPECEDGVKLAVPADDWGASAELLSSTFGIVLFGLLVWF